MARKAGFGKVMLTGKAEALTQKDYKDAAVRTMEELGAKGKNGIYLDTNTIIAYASSRNWVDRPNKKRKAHSHPMFRIMTTLWENDVITYRHGANNLLEYRLK